MLCGCYHKSAYCCVSFQTLISVYVVGSMDTFEQFVRDMLDGKVEAYLKSEPVPENNDQPVKVIFLFHLLPALSARFFSMLCSFFCFFSFC